MQHAAEYGLLLHQMDVKSAYLNAPIDCELYIDQPEGYEKSSNSKYDKKLVYKLHKSLYGLKQSSNNWKSVTHDFFMQNGCKQSKSDNCIYTKICENEILIYIVWVDDMIIATNSENVLLSLPGNPQ